MRRLAVFVFLAAGLAAPARAADWGPPTADFVADMVFRNGAGQVREARLYYTVARQRFEYVVGQEPVALLVDHTAKKNWLLLLNRRQYKPLSFVPPEFFLGISNPASKRHKVGDETLLGQPVERLEVSTRTRNGDRFDGLAWATAQRIIVRIEGTVARGKRKQKISITMTKLTIGAVDPTLLTLPANYTPLPAGKTKR